MRGEVPSCTFFHYVLNSLPFFNPLYYLKKWEMYIVPRPNCTPFFKSHIRVGFKFFGCHFWTALYICTTYQYCKKLLIVHLLGVVKKTLFVHDCIWTVIFKGLVYDQNQNFGSGLKPIHKPKMVNIYFDQILTLKK